jgi:hypothetical protein
MFFFCSSTCLFKEVNRIESSFPFDQDFLGPTKPSFNSWNRSQILVRWDFQISKMKWFALTIVCLLQLISSTTSYRRFVQISDIHMVSIKMPFLQMFHRAVKFLLHIKFVTCGLHYKCFMIINNASVWSITYNGNLQSQLRLALAVIIVL